MSLIKCIECGNEISDKAKTCIHCGCPITIESKSLFSKSYKCLVVNVSFEVFTDKITYTMSKGALTSLLTGGGDSKTLYFNQMISIDFHEPSSLSCGQIVFNLPESNVDYVGSFNGEYVYKNHLPFTIKQRDEFKKYYDEMLELLEKNK